MKNFTIFVWITIITITSYVFFQKQSHLFLSQPIGYATLNWWTIWGKWWKTIVITNYEELIKEISDNNPKIIKIKGTIELPKKLKHINNEIHIWSNKTILWIGKNTKITWNWFYISGKQNIIIKNITFENAFEYTWSNIWEKPESDNITIKHSQNIWIDHCSFSDGDDIDKNAEYHDGSIDITEWSNLVTVSYCYFSNHDKVMLIWADNKDKYMDDWKLKVTLHHNFFEGTIQRHPRVRFGEVHMFNNCFKDIKNYWIGVWLSGNIYSENNIFINIKKPILYIKTWSFLDIWSLPRIWDLKWSINRKPRDYYKYKIDNIENTANICFTYAWAGRKDRE